MRAIFVVSSIQNIIQILLHFLIDITFGHCISELSIILKVLVVKSKAFVSQVKSLKDIFRACKKLSKAHKTVKASFQLGFQNAALAPKTSLCVNVKFISF